MKNTIIFLALLTSAPVFADGFKCQTLEHDLAVKVFNHTDANIGTRKAATMIISDLTVQEGRKTIAKFTDSNVTLSSSGATYVARVDLRYNDSGRKGENIGGTKLGELKNIIVDVDYSYAEPVEDGESVLGTITLLKRNGEALEFDLECERYLKGN